VPADQIVKGYPYSAEQCIALSEEDLATLEPTDDKTIYLEHFLAPTDFDLTLLAGRSLYLAPAHPAAMKPFVVIRQALLRADKWALGRTVFSSKRQLVIVYPADEVLLVQTLFDPAQRRAAMPVDHGAVEVDRKEVDALTRWIESMVEPIRWQELRDDTDARLAQLVEAKLRGANDKASKRNGKPALAVARAAPESKPSAPRRQRAAA
jgi:DNA end-binding protein Ku